MSDADPRNRLNDLSNKEWLRETKSFWISRAQDAGDEVSAALAEFIQWLGDTRPVEQAEEILDQIDSSFVYSKAPPRGKLKSLHPATFSERDIERLIMLFSREGERVLDPFLGSGSALIAAARSGRHGVGIELSEHWAQIANQRIEDELASLAEKSEPVSCEVLTGDARDKLDELAEGSVDFIVTSPPYWSILTKKAGMKVRAERESKGLPTQYSEDEDDLGNIESYEDFLAQLADVFGHCKRVLRPKGYMAVIVSDFRHGPKFHLFHADLARHVEDAGLPLKGLTILAQDSKNLYPFAIPYSFVSNIHHQYILVFQRPAEKDE